MVTHNYTGTSAADSVTLRPWGTPSSGDIYNFDGLGGNDTLYLNNNETAALNSTFLSSGFTINGVQASTITSLDLPAGIATLAGATTGGTILTINLTSIESIVFSDRTVTLIIPDITQPSLSSAAVHGTSLVMTYDETLDPINIPVAGAFTVTSATSGAHPVSAVSVNATAHTVTLTLQSAVTAGESVTVAYTDPTTIDDHNAIQDTVGNDASTITYNFLAVDPAVASSSGGAVPIVAGVAGLGLLAWAIM